MAMDGVAAKVFVAVDAEGAAEVHVSAMVAKGVGVKAEVAVAMPAKAAGLMAARVVSATAQRGAMALNGAGVGPAVADVDVAVVDVVVALVSAAATQDAMLALAVAAATTVTAVDVSALVHATAAIHMADNRQTGRAVQPGSRCSVMPATAAALLSSQAPTAMQGPALDSWRCRIAMVIGSSSLARVQSSNR